HQCLPKAPHRTWEQAAAPTLVGATAYRMLLGWPPHVVQEGDVVLIWGGAGGLGSMAIQIVRVFGGKAVAVVSSEDRAEFCLKLGAVGAINRGDFSHWGMPPHWSDAEGYGRWAEGAKAFGKAVWDAVGEKRNPSIVQGACTSSFRTPRNPFGCTNAILVPRDPDRGASSISGTPAARRR